MEQSQSPSASAPSLGVMVIVVGTIVRIVPSWRRSCDPPVRWPPGSRTIRRSLTSAGTPLDLVAKAAMLGILVLSLLSIVGLLQRRTWGWTLAIVTAGLVLALNIGWWASGEARYLSMAVNTIVVFYLSQRDLRAAYGVTG